MAFWARTRSGSRSDEWRSFAATLELVENLEMAEKLRHNLDLGPGVIAPIYSLTRSGQPQLVLFEQTRERHGPAGTVTNVRSCVLLRANGDNDYVSLRATARRNKVMEAIEAGRTGSSRVDTGDDPAFDDRVSVYARDPQAAMALLTDGVRSVLVRLLNPLDGSEDPAVIAATVAPATIPPSLVIGNKNLLLTLEGQEAVDFERFTSLTADMLALYAALKGAG
jgi:hypothetical protein